MDLAKPSARPNLSAVGQKPEAAICFDLARSDARHLPGLSPFGQRPGEGSHYLDLATPTARQTPGMSAIGQKPEAIIPRARAGPSDYQAAVGAKGGLISFKDFAR